MKKRMAVLSVFAVLISGGFQPFGSRAAEPTIMPGSSAAEVEVSKTTFIPETPTDPASSVDLARVLALTLQQNLDIRRAVDQVAIARSRQLAQKTALLPTVTTRLEQYHYNQPINNPIVYNRSGVVLPTVELSTTLLPQQGYLTRESTHWWHAAQHDLDSTVQTSLANAAQRYYDCMEATMLVRNAQKAIEEADAQIRLTQQQAHAASNEDTTRAETQKVQQQRSLASAENQQNLNLQNLRNILNMEPGAAFLMQVPEDARPTRLYPEQTQLPDLMRALSDHPQLRRLTAEWKALVAEVSAEKVKFLPSVTTSLYVGGVGPNYANMRLSGDGGFKIQATLLEKMGTAIPIRLMEKEATVRQKQAELQLQKRSLETSLTQAFLNSQTFEGNLLKVNQEKSLATQNYDDALNRYQRKEITYVSVIDAHNALINARNTYVQVLFNDNRAQVDVLRSLGRVSPMTLLQGVAASS